MVLDRVPSRLKGAAKAEQQANGTWQPRTRRRLGEIPATLSVGQLVAGIVESTVNFGVFVDLSTCSALIHRTELEDVEIPNAKGYLPVGAAVTARVVAIDREKRRVALSLRPPGDTLRRVT